MEQSRPDKAFPNRTHAIQSSYRNMRKQTYWVDVTGLVHPLE